MLLMKKIFFDSIRTGRKTATLRYWKSQRVRIASIHIVPGLGRVRIDDVKPVAISRLRLADAVSDGFKSLKSLRDTLAGLYPADMRQGRRLYQVWFTFLGK